MSNSKSDINATLQSRFIIRITEGANLWLKMKLLGTLAFLVC